MNLRRIRRDLVRSSRNDYGRGFVTITLPASAFPEPYPKFSVLGQPGIIDGTFHREDGLIHDFHETTATDPPKGANTFDVREDEHGFYKYTTLQSFREVQDSWVPADSLPGAIEEYRAYTAWLRQHGDADLCGRKRDYDVDLASSQKQYDITDTLFLYTYPKAHHFVPTETGYQMTWVVKRTYTHSGAREIQRILRSLARLVRQGKLEWFRIR